MTGSEKGGPTGPTLIVGGGGERRTAERIVHEVDAEIVTADSTVNARTENVSASGVFISVPHLLPVGSRVRVRFRLPAGEFEAGATIVRIRPTGDRGPGIGLVFHDVSEDHRMRLEQYCPPAAPILRHGPG